MPLTQAVKGETAPLPRLSATKRIELGVYISVRLRVRMLFGFGKAWSVEELGMDVPIEGFLRASGQLPRAYVGSPMPAKPLLS